jgi:hypothetical protein
MTLDRFITVIKAPSIRTITLTLGILVALFIFITLVTNRFPISASGKPSTPALRILSLLPPEKQPGLVSAFLERF